MWVISRSVRQSPYFVDFCKDCVDLLFVQPHPTICSAHHESLLVKTIKGALVVFYHLINTHLVVVPDVWASIGWHTHYRPAWRNADRQNSLRATTQQAVMLGGLTFKGGVVNAFYMEQKKGGREAIGTWILPLIYMCDSGSMV